MFQNCSELSQIMLILGCVRAATRNLLNGKRTQVCRKVYLYPYYSLIYRAQGRVIEVKSQVAGSPISLLPSELLLIIISFLDVDAIPTLACASQLWKKICEKPLLWRFFVRKLCISSRCPSRFKTYDNFSKDDSPDYWKILFRKIISWTNGTCLHLPKIKIQPN